MVLPWVTDHQSKAFRENLLGCPYFDATSNELIFSVDTRYSLKLSQSPFSKLRKPVRQPHFSANPLKEDKENIKYLRKTFQDTFVPTSLLETCLYELERDKNDINIDNKLLIQKNAYLPNQFIAIYPDVCGKKIVIDNLNEFDIAKNNSGLNVFDSNTIEFGFPVRSIKSHTPNIFAASSNQTIRLYSLTKDSICEIFECISPDEDYFSSFDVSRYEKQICAILKKNRKLLLFNEKSSQSYDLCDNYFDCSYTLHPSLITLSGNLNKIELMDIRDTFPGISIHDKHVPFKSVQALITHEKDSNLIAISCKTDSYNIATYNYSPTSELRIYDFRYPKESIIRVGTDSPIVKFISYDSFIQDTTDNLIGLDSFSNCFHWEFRHSKSNIEYSDGILSLADCSKYSTKSKHELSDRRKFVGYSTVPSFFDDESFYMSRLTDDGEIDFCKISKNEYCESYSDPTSIDNEEETILDLSHISELYNESPEISNLNPSDICESFGQMRQSTFHLDFYWNELKAKIYKQNK